MGFRRHNKSGFRLGKRAARFARGERSSGFRKCLSLWTNYIIRANLLRKAERPARHSLISQRCAALSHARDRKGISNEYRTLRFRSAAPPRRLGVPAPAPSLLMLDLFCARNLFLMEWAMGRRAGASLEDSRQEKRRQRQKKNCGLVHFSSSCAFRAEGRCTLGHAASGIFARAARA